MLRSGYTLPASFLSQIFSPSRYTSNRPFAPGVREIPTSPPNVLKNSLATHVAVAWCCHATQYRISTRTFHSPFVAISTLLTSRLPPSNTAQRCQTRLYSTYFIGDVKLWASVSPKGALDGNLPRDGGDACPGDKASK